MYEKIAATVYQSNKNIHSFHESSKTKSIRYLGKVPRKIIIKIVSRITFIKYHNSSISRNKTY